jgi:hypothetical protein
MTITAIQSLQLAAHAWKPGTKMLVIIDDGWARGFMPVQTLHECIQAGYSACIAEPAIKARWQDIDDQMVADRLASERKEAVDLYEAYWARNPNLEHHQVRCPNLLCQVHIKLPRPEPASEEVWDSLAVCPYCRGTLFYESRAQRIDVAYKGHSNQSHGLEATKSRVRTLSAELKKVLEKLARELDTTPEEINKLLLRRALRRKE